MSRPDAERRFLRLAQQRGELRLEDAAALVEELEERGTSGLHAIRDLARQRRVLPEKVAYDLFQEVSRELREVPEGIARIGGYEILERIGRGSMGVVYRARQLSLEKEVALKILPPRLSQDPIFVERFLREARAAGRLNHPNVVSALDAGYSDGFHYFAMELVSGSSLREIVESRGAVEEREALKVAFFVAKALRHAHEHGIIHRDVKPANVMVTSDGRVKLTDLGLARTLDRVDCSLTQHGKSVGTPYYMSPEQAVEERKVDARCDVYALGCTLFYALAGQPPFDGPTPSAILAKHVSAPIPDPRSIVPTVGEPAARLVMHMLAKRPEARPQSARDVCEVLRSILARPDAPRASQTFESMAPVAPPAQSQSLESFWVGQSAAQPGVGEALATAAASAEAERAAAAGAKRGKRRVTPSESSISLMELQPVSSATVRRLRRAAAGPAGSRHRSHAGGAVAVAIGAVILAVGALTYAISTSQEGAPAARLARQGSSARADREVAEVAGAATGGAAGRRRLSSPNKSREAIDREDTVAAALARDAERPALEAAKAGAEAESLAGKARTKKAADARRAAELAARVDEGEAKAQKALLLELAPKIAAGKIEDALAAAEKAAKSYANAPVRARAERDVAAIRASLALRGLALEALALREGKRDAIPLRSGSTVEGEVAAVAREQGTVTIRLANGGTFAIDARAISDQGVTQLVRSALGFHHAPFLVAEGLRLAYGGDLAKARPMLAEAAEKAEPGAKEFLARVDEIAKERGVDLAKPAEPVVAAAPPPAEKPPAPTTEAVDGAVEKDGPVLALTEQMLLKMFETQPMSFTADGRVRFRYTFLAGQKRLGTDFEIAGAEPRFDAALNVVKLDGDATRLTHRAVFAGDVKVEAELVYARELQRGAALSLFLEDAKAHASSLESVFGIALIDRRKGKIAAFSGPVNALDFACRELKDHACYCVTLGVEGGTATTTLDGAVRGHIEDAPAGIPRRAGLACEHVYGQLRSITIEGRLDLRWVAREIARRGGVHASR